MVSIRNIARGLFRRGGNEVIGLDIGSCSIKVIRLCRCGDHIMVSGGGMVEISHGAGSPEYNKAASTVEAICRCVDQCGFNARRAVCAVDAPDVAVRSFNFDPMPAEDTGYSILMEAEHISPADMDHTVVDYQLMGGYQEGKEVKGMLAAARSDAIIDKCHLAEMAHIKTILVDVDSLALINCFSRFSGSSGSEVSAIVNLGDSWTNLAVTGGDRLPFIRSISYPGSEILSGVGAFSGLSVHEVRSILFNENVQHCKYPIVMKSFLNRLGDLVPEISDTLRYCQARHRDCSVDRVYICGDFAGINGVCDLFSERLYQHVELWNPVKIAGFSSSVVNRHELESHGPGMAVAMGLSMRMV